MTREEASRILEVIRSRSIVKGTSDALLMAINVLKENEPAPSEDNTGYENQKKYFRNNNDSTEKKKCQEAITAAVNSMCDIYNEMSEEEQRAWDLGEVYKRVLDVQKIIEEDKK